MALTDQCCDPAGVRRTRYTGDNLEVDPVGYTSACGGWGKSCLRDNEVTHLLGIQSGCWYKI
ncbi:hypothetical protein PISMIDRAFT_687675 [Pisolithus microcarpus 441]|uniref:Uncharacterized protein n=1 Tax=Pisolithus microcarpus 441 TaxID=765257 RepID=A0A0C9XRB3_9AGAM|nr:hypothetical protein PISMIDRAFT_687675 [Pisolithus microcarpus 441]